MLSQVISSDNQYMKIKYISPVLSTDNISCMGGVVCTSFRRCGLIVSTLSIKAFELLSLNGGRFEINQRYLQMIQH